MSEGPTPTTPAGAHDAHGTSAPTPPVRNEGWLTILTVASLGVLVLAFVGFVRAGSQGSSSSNNLPAALSSAGSDAYTSGGGCNACHGASGGGGVGPAFSGGAIVQTFPNPVDHVRWVILGSTEGADVYTAAGKSVKGGMPGFGATMSLKEIVQVVLYERQILGGQTLDLEIEQWADLRTLPDEMADLGYTADEVEEILTEIATETGLVIPSA